MSKLKEGMRVQIIGCDNELLTGTIELLNDDIAIVHANNDTRYKRTIDEIAILKESEPVELEQPEERNKKPNEEPVEKSKITITPEKFRDITSGVVCKESAQGGPMVAILGTILLSKIHKALFVDEWEND